MIIDCHTHTFPDPIAASALNTLSKHSGVHPLTDGTTQGLSDAIKQCGADYGVVLNIATNEKQQRKVNDFAAVVNKMDNLIGFGSVYPASEMAYSELERIAALGLKGIKLHPDYQDFFVDDAFMIPIYKHIAKLGLITVFHAGRDIGIPEPVHCTPERLARVLKYFDDAPVVAAHLGGYMCWDETETYLAGTSCYLDTSYTYGRIPLPQAKRILEKHGADRVLFGSDSPWSRIDNEIFFVRSLGLSETETNAVLGSNAARLLRLEG